jgi:hypothetical protein
MLGDNELADDAREAGLSYVMRQYKWEQIEPAQDQFNFTQIDDWYYGALEPNGLGAIIILRTGQCWATDNSNDSTLGIPLPSMSSAPPLDYDDYYDFIYRFVDHFKGDIQHLIIENDPLTKYQWYGTAGEYMELTGVAYQAAKDANSNCVVIGNKFPGMSFGYLIAADLLRHGKNQEAISFWNGYHSRRLAKWQVDSLEELLSYLTNDFASWAIPFADEILSHAQSDHMDAMGFNYYLHYDYVDEVVGWLKYRMENNGYSRALLDLEHGVKDERSVVTDVTAAQELVKGYVITHSLGVGYISWYPFTMDTVSHNYENLKLMYDYADAEYLPTYYAMRTLAEHCTPHHRFSEENSSSFYRRFSFRNTGTQLVDLDIIWSDETETTLTIPFRDPFEYAIVTNYLGNAPDTLTRDGDNLTLDVGKAPNLIRWMKSLASSHLEPVHP